MTYGTRIMACGYDLQDEVTACIHQLYGLNRKRKVRKDQAERIIAAYLLKARADMQQQMQQLFDDYQGEIDGTQQRAVRHSSGDQGSDREGAAAVRREDDSLGTTQPGRG